MRILVCGGRNYSDSKKVHDVLLAHKPTVIIHGCAKGADTYAGMFAKAYRIHVHEFPARWNHHGKSAGYIRNKRMLEGGEPDLVIAFPGGKGTANMVNLAKAANVPVIEIKET